MWGLLVGAGAWLWLRRRYRWRIAWAPLTVGILALMLSVMCGGGGRGPSNPGTPAGNYALTVTGSVTSGSTTFQHTITLTLTVN